MKIRPQGAELFHADGHDEANSLYSQICKLALGLPHTPSPRTTRNCHLTLRRLMSYIYIYGAPILDVSRSHTTTQHSR